MWKELVLLPMATTTGMFLKQHCFSLASMSRDFLMILL